MKKKRVEISLEVQRAVTIKSSNVVLRAWCPQCNQQVTMLLPDAAAVLAGISVREIFRRVEGGALHFVETPEGQIRICAASINQV